jgi:flagellar biogenesis protein FliO
MTQVLVIMILSFVFFSIYFLIKIKNRSVKLTKSKELNNLDNKLEKKYQFIKGLY